MVIKCFADGIEFSSVEFKIEKYLPSTVKSISDLFSEKHNWNIMSINKIVMFQCHKYFDY